MSLGAAFLERLEAEPGRAFLLGDGGEHSTGEVARRARRVVAALAEAGVKPGDRVALCLRKGPWLPAFHTGVLAGGAGIAPLNPAYPDATLADLIRRAEPALAVGDADFAARGRRLVPEIPWWSVGGGDVVDGVEPFPERGLTATSLASCSAGDLALLVFTSGTTGRPKGVPLSHANLRSNLDALRSVWRWTARDRLLHVLPVFHLHGLGVALYGSLLAGSSIVFHERFDAERVLREAGPSGATLLMAVPTMLKRLIDAADGHPASLSGLRAVISGSAGLAPALFERFERRFGLAPIERYGMSETMMNASNPAAGTRKPGSVGPPVPGVEIALRDVDEESGAGHVWVRGPNVFAGYWRDPRATAEVFEGDWFRTGDLGRSDEDGYLRLVGRAKEIVVTGGYNVSPAAVELALEAETDPDLLELAVGGVTDEDLGERIVVFAVPRSGTDWQALEARLHERAVARLPRYAWPRDYRRVQALPRNELGKVLRAQLGDRQDDGERR